MVGARRGADGKVEISMGAEKAFDSRPKKEEPSEMLMIMQMMQ